MLKKTALILTAIAVVFAMGRCDICNKGKLILNLTQDKGKTWLPALDMEIAGYTINGVGPGGETFTRNATNEIVTIENLAFGDWTVNVSGFNADGITIGSGSGTATVIVKETVVLNIIIRPLEGVGSIDASVIWNTSAIQNAAIVGQLIPETGPINDLAFTITDDTPSAGKRTARAIEGNIPVGYYTLSVKLMDNTHTAMGAVEIVRIVKDQPTIGTFIFDEVNPGEGTIRINITVEIQNPIEVTLAGQSDTITAGSSMNVTASVPAEAGNATYVWYINGDAVDATNTPSYDAGTGREAGVYRLDVTAFSADGTRAGSATHTFHISD